MLKDLQNRSPQESNVLAQDSINIVCSHECPSSKHWKDLFWTLSFDNIKKQTVLYECLTVYIWIVTHQGTFFQTKKYAQNNKQEYIVPVNILFDRFSLNAHSLGFMQTYNHLYSTINSARQKHCLKAFIWMV